MLWALLALIAAMFGKKGDAPPPPKTDPPPPPPPKPGRPAAAVGDPSPAWPLLTSSRRVTDDLGNCRPVDLCKQGKGERKHAGEDLLAPQGTVIVAPESGVVIDARASWYEGSGLVLLQTDSGIVINLGEVEPHSYEDFGVKDGTRVTKGQKVARVGRHNQLHFETYVNGTKQTSRWMANEPPPSSLLDPIPYLLAAGGQLDGAAVA